jgi:hypothetical protein
VNPWDLALLTCSVAASLYIALANPLPKDNKVISVALTVLSVAVLLFAGLKHGDFTAYYGFDPYMLLSIGLPAAAVSIRAYHHDNRWGAIVCAFAAVILCSWSLGLLSHAF